ncbi:MULTISPECIES: hypothetical protein [unclassified Caballeronia]|uniref:hypothetical protein n=1 Tax=unclassified Caballeronia TaxID=2646786 RepID=UPI00285CC03E|nr:MULTISPECIES: hypothetical protein [unclassified Caballeronia]MDR5740529.1 hypothetical protein [Caballeronia sp. LZ016]MDR5808950.1 hypothetical protein [Caballeronia sp. LZ019]
MRNEASPNITGDDPLRAEARALATSIELIRRARGKKNPRDCIVGTSEWESVCNDFACDLRWALGLEGDDTDIPAGPERLR